VKAPVDLQQLPRRTGTTAMRPWDWALPPRPVDLELISSLPSGWAQLPRAERRPPLLFVPGFGGAAWQAARHWLGAAVRRRYPAHALSLRGHGASGGRRGPLAATTMRDHVHDVLAVAAALPQPPVLIGHGTGAVVVQEVLARYPARAAVLVAPTPISGVGDVLARWARRHPQDLPTLLSGRLPVRPELLFCGLGHDRAVAHLHRLDREPPTFLAELARPRLVAPTYCPVGVAGCAADEVVTPAEVRQTARVHGTKAFWLPGAGHLAMLDSGHGVALDVILDWVDEAVGSGAGARAVAGHR
jgi:pimeloyl-ACP methyl ester carboxylesterase